MKNDIKIKGFCLAEGEYIEKIEFCPCICEDELDEYCVGEECTWYAHSEN